MNIQTIRPLKFSYPLAFKNQIIKPSTSDVFIKQDINKILFEKYGINSTIKNPYLLKSLYEVVKDFCALNGDDLFEGLELAEADIDKNYSSEFSAGINADSVIISFNKNFDWKNTDKIVKDSYNSGAYPSDNPKCLLYRDLAHFLNFKYNKYAYILEDDVKIKKKYSRRLTNNDFSHNFSANYIAGRMCGITYPEKINQVYFDCSANTDLKFPKANEDKKMPICNFSTIDEAQDYLYKKYGIKSEFVTLFQANAFCAAIDDMAKFCHDDKIFSKLNILVDFSYFGDTNTSLITVPNQEEDCINIIINPAVDWKKEQKMDEIQYNSCIQPSSNPKNIYHHELSHYLEYRNLMLEDKIDEFEKNDNENAFSKKEKNLAYRVSSYATSMPSEFCAEYISAKMAGLKYPLAVDELLKKYWHGNILHFD